MRKGGEKECHHGGGHQETGDALPAAAEVWKGTNTDTALTTELTLMLTQHGCVCDVSV